MEKKDLREIKKGEFGTGLLIENDGYISINDTEHNKLIKEEFDNATEWHVPNPFILDVVMQKFDIKNANGRIYPERTLKREVEKYQQKIAEHRAYGECYKPDALILTEEGWKTIADVKEGENIITLNNKTNEIEIKPINKKIEYEFNGEMVSIKGRNIDDVVTPNHGYPIYDRYDKFKCFKTAEEIYNEDKLSHCYIPKQGNWVKKGDEYFILKGIESPSEKILKLHPDCAEDKKIPMSTFMKFMGIYLSEGDYRKKNNDVNIYQKKENVCKLIEEMLIELGLGYTIYGEENKRKIFRICDPRLNKYVSQLGNCYTKYIPKELKNQSKDNLRILYDWFVLGDGRIRGDKRKKYNLTDDIFSTSKQLALDLNEIQLKIGYSGNYHVEVRNNDRLIENRTIDGKNCKPLHFSLRSLTKGIYLDKRFLKVSQEHYEGKVMCVEVPNHIWYVMCNGKCHWTKNCNHPSESTIDLGRISHNIVECHWEGHTLVGKLEFNLSEGFRRYGICSTLGDTCALLILNGMKIGVSSRGVGSVEQKLGNTIVGEDFELICFDVVSDPSTPGAFIGNKENLQQYVENDENKNKKSKLLEKLNKIDKILMS